jgi:hypothetical protein
MYNIPVAKDYKFLEQHVDCRWHETEASSSPNIFGVPPDHDVFADTSSTASSTLYRHRKLMLVATV